MKKRVFTAVKVQKQGHHKKSRSMPKFPIYKNFLNPVK